MSSGKVEDSVLANARTAIARINTGKDVNEDSWMAMWCNTNWGKLLQPAPLSIALLGSIMIATSSTEDFALVTDDSIKFRHVRYPDSFKACLQQMVGEGYVAFETASNSMTRIQNASSQLPSMIRNAVLTIVQASPEEIRALLPVQLQGVTKLTDICLEAAIASDEAFTGISKLAQEILEACSSRRGKAERSLRDNEGKLILLNEEREHEEEVISQAKEEADFMKQQLKQALDDFHDAARNIPSGWSLLGMQLVQSLAGSAMSIPNAATRMGSILANLALDKFEGTNKPAASPAPQNSTIPNKDILHDPGLHQANLAMPFFNALELLVSGGPNGKPDWDRIRAGSGSRNSSAYVKVGLEKVRSRLAPGKPISARLLPQIEIALQLLDNITRIAGSMASTDDRALDNEKARITKLIEDHKQLVTECNLILNQPGSAPSGPATPPTAPTGNGNVARMTVEMEKFKVDQTRASLFSSRDSYDKAATRLLDQQEGIRETISEITSLKLANMTLTDILPVLKEAVNSFTHLRSQFSQLTEFFRTVSSLLKDIMHPQIETWTNTMGANMNLVLGGVTLSDFVRQAMYSQMMVPVKVSMLSEKIAQTYLTVSDKYIMPAQRQVGQLLMFQDQPGEEGKKELMKRLREAQITLDRESKAASHAIYQLVEEDRKTFADKINQRLERIEGSLAAVMPEITAPPPREIMDTVKAHVKEFDDKDEALANADPAGAYDLDNLM